MAHKTFISYKYSEARALRDMIINALPNDYAQYYMGETSDSPDMGDEKLSLNTWLHNRDKKVQRLYR